MGKDADSFHSEAKVYSLWSNSWQRIQDFPYYLNYGKSHGHLVCGALHWIVSHKRGSSVSNLIAAFDLTTNEYRVVDHPKALNELNDIVKLEGCLCLPCFSSGRADLWVMKDYGVKESWSMLYSVSQPEPISSFQFIIPLAYSRSGNEVLLLQDNVKLLWYSLKERRVRMISPRGCPDDFLPEVSVESLVPLGGKADDYAKKNDQKCAKEKLIKGIKKRNDFLSQGFKLKL